MYERNSIFLMEGNHNCWKYATLTDFVTIWIMRNHNEKKILFSFLIISERGVVPEFYYCFVRLKA
jgi:hypothetical protein